MARKILVTPALTYANGPAHLGHLTEHVQVNIFVRALRMNGENPLYVSGADAHGTPIELNAQKHGMEPAAFAQKWQKEHGETFARFGIEFDGGYGTTDTPENEAHAVKIFEALKSAGHIATRDVEQLFDPEKNRFLPDRMVRGECPKCGALDQYGDSCEVCGSTYSPTDLTNPKSAISGATPVLKSSKHYFFELHHYTEKLRNFANNKEKVQPEVYNFLKSWLEDGLKDWDISRDGPYFGFKIPGEKDKYFYVWLDAPVGYISLCEKAAKERGETLADYFENPDARIIHFIGKDIIYFHTLFWPAMLMGAGYTLPERVHAHGMLTINGEKMSKSRGTFILANDFADNFDPEAFRYYLACKLDASISDLDLSFSDFKNRINADLVNNLVNLLSRSVPMLGKLDQGKVIDFNAEGKELCANVSAELTGLAQAYMDKEYAHVARQVAKASSFANLYLQESKPWELLKSDPQKAAQVLSAAVWSAKACIAFLKPIVPKMAAATENILKHAPFTFANALSPFEAEHHIGKYERLFSRVEDKSIQNLLQTGEVKGEQSPLQKLAQKKEAPQENHSMIQFEDFTKIDLRAARVLAAKDVEGSNKLISLELDVGPLGKRHVLTGLKPHVSPEDLNGKTLVLVANLKPRKMRFGLSEGMVLSTGDNPPKPIILDGATPGDKIS